MTIGEKVSNMVDWIARSLTGDEGDYTDRDTFSFGEPEPAYETDRNLARKPKYTTRVTEDESNNVLRHPNYKGHEVRIIEPRSFGDTTQIVKQLLDQKTVVLNLHLLDKEQSQRTIDFVCGAAFALGGAPQKVGDTVFVFTPNSVQLSVEAKEQNAFGTESLWGGSL